MPAFFACAMLGSKPTRTTADRARRLRRRRAQTGVRAHGRKRCDGVGKACLRRLRASSASCRGRVEERALTVRPHASACPGTTRGRGAPASVKESVEMCGILGEHGDYAFRPGSAAPRRVLEPGSAVWLSIERKLMV